MKIRQLHGILFDVGGTLIVEGQERLFPGVKDSLKTLSRNFALGVVSNTDIKDEREVREIMRRLNIEHLFRSIIVSATVGVRKPNVRIFEMALSQLGLSPRQAAMVGDRPEIDIVGARQAGLLTVLIDWSAEIELRTLESRMRPDFVVHSFEELQRIFSANE